MKLTTTLLPLFLATVATAGFLGNSQAVLDDDKKLEVPGSNPLKYCEEPVGNILQIETVDLSPNPPAAGKTLSIKASGNFTEEIEEGAFVVLTVKWGVVRLLYREADLCEQMKEVDKECPLEKGVTTITKDVDLPAQIPPGIYSVIADVYTKDKKKITCLTASVKF